MDSLRASGNRGGWRVASQRRPDGRFITLRYGRHRIGPRRYFSVLLLRFRIVALIPFLTVIVQFGVQFGKSGRFRCQFFLLGEGARRLFLGVFQVALQRDQAPLLVFQIVSDLFQRIADADYIPLRLVRQFCRIGEILLH